MKRLRMVPGLSAIAAIALVASACTSTASTAPASVPASAASVPASAAAGASYKIGVSNTLQGNGWREEMICSIKAEALSSGRVSTLTIDHRNTDAAGQLSDIRDLIAKGVNAIIVNPASPDAVNAALKEAIDKGITVVAIDQGVTQAVYTSWRIANGLPSRSVYLIGPPEVIAVCRPSSVGAT